LLEDPAADLSIGCEREPGYDAENEATECEEAQNLRGSAM